MLETDGLGQGMGPARDALSFVLVRSSLGIRRKGLMCLVRQPNKACSAKRELYARELMSRAGVRNNGLCMVCVILERTEHHHGMDLSLINDSLGCRAFSSFAQRPCVKYPLS